MKINWRTVFLSILILLLLLAVSSQLIKEGLKHPNTRIYFSQASENFGNGEYGQGLKYGLVGIRNALDAGLRWTIGKPHFIKAQSMFHDRKDLYGALDECELTQTIVGYTYDNEGMVDNLCWRIKAEINPDIWQNPLLPVPTKTLEP